MKQGRWVVFGTLHDGEPFLIAFHFFKDAEAEVKRKLEFNQRVCVYDKHDRVTILPEQIVGKLMQ